MDYIDRDAQGQSKEWARDAKLGTKHRPTTARETIRDMHTHRDMHQCQMMKGLFTGTIGVS